MIVIDASVWISYLVQQDTNHTATKPWLTKILTDKAPVAAPILLLAEVGGAISRRLGGDDIGERAVNQLLAIPTLRLVSMGHSLSIQAARIAANHRLRGADAFYVTVAAYLNVPLISWDKEHLNRVSDLITAYSPASDSSHSRS
ncbi:MAG: type II toxin-antitoxin system VapC family toxin [Chloroflexi bacterium]|nr:type II toxin-antitoxin system VapC family toxin [Chloroflexota bacterium]